MKVILDVQGFKRPDTQHPFKVRSFKNSLQIFSETENLASMDRLDIEQLPKEFLLTFASNQLDRVWNKLPALLRNDKDVLMFRRCRKHFETVADDQPDRMPPLKRNCVTCMLEDMQLDI